MAGLAAYTTSPADALEVDADYPADNPDVLGIRVMVHGDQCTMTCERHNGGAFLRKMIATAKPDLEPGRGRAPSGRGRSVRCGRQDECVLALGYDRS